MFKAGRSGGRGTGSLGFMQNIECEFRNAPRSSMMGFKLIKDPDRDRARYRDESPVVGPSVVYYGPTCAWDDWDTVTRYVGDFLEDRGYAGSVMRQSSIHRLISTIVMVASECIDDKKISEFDATTGKLWISGVSLD